MQDLFDKHRGLMERGAALGNFGANPLAVSNSQVISPTRAIINGRETILAGTNNYMGVTFEPILHRRRAAGAGRVRHRHHRLAHRQWHL